jgi:hypothetical protein
MFLFTKRVTLADGTKDEIARKEKQLNDAGIKTNSWCTSGSLVISGPQMRTADWADGHYVNHEEERKVYHLEVAAKDQYAAMKVLMGEDAALGEDFIK